MITEVILPVLGETMNEGTIVEWVKKEGDPVERGDILFVIESDKATLEVEAPTKGFLRQILVPAGQTVPVLTVVALITTTADEDLAACVTVSGSEAQVAEAAEPITIEPVTFEPATLKPETWQPETRIFASPRARKLAREKGVDLALVTGTGPNGRIVEQDVLTYVDMTTVSGTGVSGRVVKADVEAAAQAAVVSPPPASAVEGLAVESVPLTGLRRIIAERMATSARTTARVTLVTEADATAFVEVREQLKAKVGGEWGFAPGYNDLLGLIVARALREFPYMNARLSTDGQTIERWPVVNLGMAVDTERGLLVPVIRNADQKGLRAFGTELRALVERARAGRSLPDDLTGGTFTITNLGMYDIDAFTPIINPPETAILGVGRIQPKPVARDGEIVVRQMWTLSLAFDHRLVDGAPAARFLQRIKQLIENPYLLLG
ncbi:MAG: 2-oxo acid dehydrogenase subunit E2 [Anaerolineae bacterium]|jgi:pyruvate dehydrogenase E2 component (dihydrolipoamide acetyltransferase)|nr:2-oxo acid dehydrogenase subunit E2 [Anaerolineae bacterium]MDH7474775.1 dihydrolipoamide acetyltransferase family protein [Anaerolineae bacterium]